MSTQITEAMVRQYHGNVTQVFQQGASKLRGTVREQSCNAKMDTWDRIGKVTAVKRTVRHGDTPQTDTPHTRRVCFMDDYETNDFVDKQDIIRILIDPKSSYAEAQGKSLGRTFDSVIIAAMSAAVLTGEDGTTSVAFSADWPATRASASSLGGDEDQSTAAWTVANLLTLKKSFDRNDVPPDGRHIVCKPSCITQLLAASSAPMAASSDYNTVKALVQGEIDTFVGFKFHTSNLLPLAAGTDYYNFAYHESAIGVSLGSDVITRVDERKDKSYLWQVYSALTLGAVRVQGEGVIRFRTDDSL